MSIAELVQKTLEYKNDTIKALQYCGADISDNAGLKDFEKAVYSISTTNNAHFTKDTSEAYEKTVPADALRHAQLISVGGKTKTVQTSPNLCKDAVIGGVVNTPVDTGQEYPISYTGTILPKGKYRFYLKAIPNLGIGVYGALLAPDGDYYSEYTSIFDGNEFDVTEPKKLWIMTYRRYTSITEAKYRDYYHKENPDSYSWNYLESYDGANNSIPLTPDNILEVSLSVSSSVILTTNFKFDNITDYTDNDDGSYTYVLTDGDFDLMYQCGEENFYASIKFKYPEVPAEGYKVYPMVYAIDSEGQPNLTDYEHCYGDIVLSPVTEIVSEGKNLLPPEALIASNWQNHSDNKWNYPLDLPDGWYCISVKLKSGATNTVYYLQGKNSNGTFTTMNACYNEHGLVENGYLSTGNKLENTSLWFNVDNKSGKIYRLYFLDLTQDRLDNVYDVQIERVNLTKEPSASYPPATYAPPTEYKPYVGTLDTVSIPDAVKKDAGWGSGLSTTYKKYSNTYDFSEKKYTKQLSDVITIDGSKIYVTYNNGSGRCLIQLGKSVMPLSVLGDYTTATTLKITAPFTAEWNDGKEWVAWINTSQDSINKSQSVFVIKLPSKYNDIAKANAWFKAMVDAGTPVQIQYPLYEPIVTETTDDTYRPPKLIYTEAGGTITFENNKKEAVPSTVKYMIYKGEET